MSAFETAMLGERVRDHEDDLGIGYVVSAGEGRMVALFATDQGAELTKSFPADHPRLPDGIIAQVETFDGSRLAVDVTDDILSMAPETVRGLADGKPHPELVRALRRREVDACRVWIVHSASAYFGLAPAHVAGGWQMSQDFRPADMAQTREAVAVKQDASLEIPRMGL